MRFESCVLTVIVMAACLSPAGAGPAPPRPQPKPTAFSSVSEMTRTVQRLRKVRRKDAGGYLEAYLYQLRMRAFPNDSVDWKRWDAAAAHRSKMPAAHIGADRNGIRAMGLGERWQFVGPRNLATPYRLFYGEGKLSGRVNAVAYDAGHPGTYYLASSGGGVWKSTDSGANWRPLSDGWTYLKANSIALDPSNTDTVYVGTGDFDGSSGYCMGIMKSTDGGATWTNYGRSDFGNTAISALVVDPDAPNIVLAAAGKGRNLTGYVWRSVDAGVTWSPVVTALAAWSDLKVGAMPATGGGRAYYATGIYNGGHLWRSTDQGATWTRLSPPITAGGQYDQNALECATSPTDPGTVYLVSGYDQKILKSANYGATDSWTDITGNFPNGTDNYNWSQRSYDIHAHCTTRTVAGNPVDVLYVGLITLAQSLSGDAVWRDVGLTYTNSALTHNDAHAMAFDPTDPNKALVGNDGGVFGYTYNPTADAWSFDSTLSSTLGVTEFYRIAPHPTNPDKILGGTQDNASPLSTGDLLNWRNVGQGDGGFCAINPQDPLTQYATAQFLGVFRTKDEWATTIKTTPSTGSDTKAFIAPIAISPSQPRYVYAGTNYLWRWDETTASWTARLGGQALAGAMHYVTAIAVSATDAARIYTGSDDGKLWMTANGGSNWQLIGAGIVSLPPRAITSITVNPTDPGDIFVGLSGTGAGHLWRCASTQAGAARTWRNLSGSGAAALPDVPVNAIALDPDAPSTTFYVATDVGVMASQDGGATWGNATQPLGLPNVQVNDLVMVPGTRTLYAGTYGRGIWRIGLPRGLATRLSIAECSGPAGSSVSMSATLTKSLDTLPLQGKTVGFTVAGSSIGSAVTDAAGAASVPHTIVDAFASPMVGTGAAFVGDGTYGASSAIGRLTITQTTSSLAVTNASGLVGGAVNLTATLTRGTDNAGVIGRLVAFTMNGTAAGSAATAAGGAATLSYLIPAVTPEGSHALAAAFAGDALYGPSSGSGTLSVTNSGLPVTYLTVPNRSNIGGLQSVPLGAFLKRAIDNAALGGKTVTFKIDGTAVASAATNGSGIALVYWTTPAGYSGTHEIRAEFAGDVAYLSCYGIGYINPGTTAATSLSVGSASGSFGQTVSLAATLTKSADGSLLSGKTVAFAVGGASVGSATTSASGVASISTVITDNLAAGANTISAAFTGDSGYSASNGAGTLTVARTASVTAVQDAAGEAGGPTSLRATLSRSTDAAAISERTMAFTVAATSVGSVATDASGLAALSFAIPSGWGAGTYAIGASFAGDTKYSASSGSGSLTVSLSAPAATTLVAPDVTAATGASAILTATLTKSSDSLALAGRTVSFTLDATAVGTAVTGAGGVAPLPYVVPEAAALGAHAVVASFAGEAAYGASTDPATLTVTTAGAALTVANASGDQGSSVTLSATLKRATDNALLAGRSVAFTVDGATVGSATTSASGVASLAYAVPAAAAVGAHPIAAAFAGDAKHDAAGGSATLTVVTAGTRPTYVALYTYAAAVGINSKSISYLYEIAAGGSLPPVAGRTLRFTAAGTQIATAVTGTDGRAIFWYVPSTAGTFTAQALFDGDTMYRAGSATGTLTVTSSSVSPTTLVAPDVTAAIGASASLTATLTKSSDSSALAGRTISFALDATAVGTAVTGAGGVAALAYVVPEASALGAHAVVASFAGEAAYGASTDPAALTVTTAAAALTVANASGAQGSSVTLAATLKRSTDSALLAGRSVAFTVDGAAVGSATTDASGVASLAYSIPAAAAVGSHPIAAAFAGDAKHTAVGGSASLTVSLSAPAATSLVAPDVTAAIGASASLTAMLTKSSDSSALAGRTISFTLDAAAVGTAVTGAGGVAALAYVVPEAAALGAHAVVASFVGEAAYGASTDPATLTFTTAAAALTVANASGAQGSSVTLAATLKRSTDNALLAGRSVAFTVDGAAVGSATTDASGVASLAYSIPAAAVVGSHPIAAAFAGDAKHNAAGGSASLTVGTAGGKPTYVWLYTYKGTVGVSSKSVSYLYEVAGGGALLPTAGRTLRFTVAGTQITDGVTASDGKVIFWYVPASAGTFAAQALFDGDAVYKAGSATGSLIVVAP